MTTKPKVWNLQLMGIKLCLYVFKRGSQHESHYVSFVAVNHDRCFPFTLMRSEGVCLVEASLLHR